MSAFDLELMMTVSLDSKNASENSQFKMFYKTYVRQNIQGSTIGIGCIHMYAYFYWCMHDFRQVYIDKYTHFFSMIF